MEIKKHRASLLLVCLSGFLLAFSFLFPLVVGPYIYLGILYYRNKFFHSSFSDGFLWGVCFFGIHSAGLFYVVYCDGASSLRMIYPFIFIVYFALHSGVWMWIISRMKGKIEVFWWVGCTMVFVWYIQTYFLWPFGVVEGYPLVFPLIPLAAYPYSIHESLWQTPWIILALLFVIQVSFVEGFFKKQWWIITGIAFIICIYGNGIKQEDRWLSPSWFKQLRYIYPPQKRIYALETSQELCQTMLEKKDTTEFQLFITPESAFPFELKQGLCTKMWQVYALDNAALLISAYKKTEKQLYNSLFLITQRRIILSYDKSHLIPLFERTAVKNSSKNKDFFNLFLLKGTPFSSSSNPTPLISIKGIGPFLPLICSELFWSDYSLKYPKVPFICVLNDSYFGFTRFYFCMLLAARLKALVQKRFIVYCSWKYAYFIHPNGLIYEFR